MRAFVLMEIRAGDVDNAVEIIDSIDHGSRYPVIAFIARPLAGVKHILTYPAAHWKN